MIVVVGSINLDLVARVPRLPLGGETLSGSSFVSSPGGKGANQALAARRAGADVALFGAVGNDNFAAPALALLRAEGVDLTGVRAVAAPTGVAIIHVDATGENTIVVVAGANGTVDASIVPAAALGPGTIVAMPLEIPHEAVAAVAHEARTRGARVIVNAAPAAALPAATLAAIDSLVVNEHEAASVAAPFGLPLAPDAFCAAVHARFGTATIVTLGARGAVAFDGHGAIVQPSPAVNVVDTVGAGDALIGALAAALDRGATLQNALREGVAAGSLACTRAGAQTSLPSRADIARLAATI
ncbi:MAG TPA: ribokinase [Casimicrobiaceae bacterium]|nr:ribokinase [Casimicrobiaceae bacterium]